MFGIERRRTAGGRDGGSLYKETIFDIIIDFLMDHPIVLVMVSIALSVSVGLATTVLLVFLRTAGYIP